METFARRALRAPRLAYALLAEPADPTVEAERLLFRCAYAESFAAVLDEGIADGHLPSQDVDLTAAALVGAIGEALVGPLARTDEAVSPEHLVRALVDLSCAPPEPASRSRNAREDPERHRDLGHVLGVQALPRRGLRGPGMPGGQRLRRGSDMPGLYREAPLNSVWENSGNVTERAARAPAPGTER
ncbi:MAG TPA: hypothetical protein VGV40_03015 [Solirubrobacteraceae bacterium]|nr:hypothetical protein [Solirubrobacteraceae bacterium]